LNRKNFVSRRKRKGGERKYELLKGTWWMTLLFCEGVPELGFAIVLELHHPEFHRLREKPSLNAKNSSSRLIPHTLLHRALASL
jgi:hypothetical protein